MSHPKGQAPNQAIEVGGAADGRISNEDTSGSEFLRVTSADTTLPRSMLRVSQSFWSTMQRELLDRASWDSRTQLASAMFEWIEGVYNPRRRHTSLGDLSPADYETLHTATEIAA